MGLAIGCLHLGEQCGRPAVAARHGVTNPRPLLRVRARRWCEACGMPRSAQVPLHSTISLSMVGGRTGSNASGSAKPLRMLRPDRADTVNAGTPVRRRRTKGGQDAPGVATGECCRLDCDEESIDGRGSGRGLWHGRLLGARTWNLYRAADGPQLACGGPRDCEAIAKARRFESTTCHRASKGPAPKSHRHGLGSQIESKRTDVTRAQWLPPRRPSAISTRDTRGGDYYVPTSGARGGVGCRQVGDRRPH